MSSSNNTRQPSASSSKNGSSGSNSNLRKAKAPATEKQATRLTKGRARLINDFRRKPNSSSKVGSLGWGNDLYIYFLTKGDAAITRKDVTRWIMKHKWITGPIRGTSPRKARKLPHASGGVENNAAFAKTKKTDSAIKKDPVIKNASYNETKLNAALINEEMEDVREKIRRGEDMEGMQYLIILLSKMEEFDRWLKTAEPRLKSCLHATRILNRIEREQYVYFRAERAYVMLNSMECPICIKIEGLIQELKVEVSRLLALVKTFF